MNSENQQYRLINKFFSCRNCKKAQKSLVEPDKKSSTCIFCNSETYEISSNDYNRENIDKTYRIIFPKDENNNMEFHPRTDNFNRNINNINSNNNQNSQGEANTITRSPILNNQNNPTLTNTRINPNSNIIPNIIPREETINTNTNNPNINRNIPFPIIINPNPQNLQNAFNTNPNLDRTTRMNHLRNLAHFPFIRTLSPFNGNVNHHQDQNDDRHMIFFMDYFAIPSLQFFNDNYASNFNSNFPNPMLRIIFISTINFEEGNINHAAS